MTQYVQLSSDTTKVVTWYAGPQAITSDKPGYAEIADTDSRYVAWQNVQAANIAFANAVKAGVNITSTSVSALNGTYSLGSQMRSDITSEQVYIATTGKFTNGSTTRAWPDINGSLHTFPSTAEFTAFAEAVASYYDSLLAAWDEVNSSGNPWVAPSQPAPIA